MNSLIRFCFLAVLARICFLPVVLFGAETFRVASYNVENYLDAPAEGRPAKSAEAKAKVRESIKALNADVVALQEMGNTNALLELRAALKSEGCDYPYWEHVAGFDRYINVTVLSKFPFSARRPHTNDNFLLSGRRFRVSRGFAEVDVRVSSDYSFTLIASHLKSKLPVSFADEAELRLEEARLLREKVDARLKSNPNANVIVLGDLNDHKESKPVKMIVGRGQTGLVDTRPAEKNGDDQPNPNPRYEPRNITWTHYYGKEDTYSRVDYILLNRGMEKEWIKSDTWILTVPNWAVASDHRPIVATFYGEER